jgi:hypothetical protein
LWRQHVLGCPSCLSIRGGKSDDIIEDDSDLDDDDYGDDDFDDDIEEDDDQEVEDEDDEDEDDDEEELTDTFEEEADDEASEASEVDSSADMRRGYGSRSINKLAVDRVRAVGHQLSSRGQLQTSMTSRLEGAAAHAKEFLREVKGSHSSEFECAMIKATRPNEDPAKEKHVARLIETIATFPMATAARPSSTDYYTMMLHKLWNRMTEKDWRSVAKAVYILHRMALTLDPELHREFIKRYNALRSTLHKKSNGLYFSKKTLTEVLPGSEEYAAFLGTYAAFVLDRFVLFSGRYEECFEGQPSARHVQLLGSACRVLDRALLIDMEEGASDHKVSVHCLELVVRDCFVSGTKRGDSLFYFTMTVDTFIRLAIP